MSNDIIGLIRVLKPRYTEAGQRAALTAPGINARCILNLADATREEVLRMTRPGTVLAIQHLHLIADPTRKHQKGGMRADLWKAIDAFERKGAVFWELYTGLRTDTKAGRDTMTRAAVETLARGRHKTERSDKRGRPEADFTPQQLRDAKAIWRNVKDYPRWEDADAALAEIVSKNGRAFTRNRAFALWQGRK